MLLPFEKKEILRYSNVYFMGTEKAKDTRKMKCMISSKVNSGFD
jgi:hypothetical protein